MVLRRETGVQTINLNVSTKSGYEKKSKPYIEKKSRISLYKAQEGICFFWLPLEGYYLNSVTGYGKRLTDVLINKRKSNPKEDKKDEKY